MAKVVAGLTVSDMEAAVEFYEGMAGCIVLLNSYTESTTKAIENERTPK
jgi:hypothetical protein